MKESDAKTKICPMMSSQQGIIMCYGSECAAWESYEYEQSRLSKNIDITVKSGFYQPAKILENDDRFSYRMVYVGEGICGLITKELNND